MLNIPSNIDWKYCKLQNCQIKDNTVIPINSLNIIIKIENETNIDITNQLISIDLSQYSDLIYEYAGSKPEYSFRFYQYDSNNLKKDLNFSIVDYEVNNIKFAVSPIEIKQNSTENIYCMINGINYINNYYIDKLNLNDNYNYIVKDNGTYTFDEQRFDFSEWG